MGGIVGLIPGILLIMVAYGGSYGLTGTDIFTFIIMSIIGITLAGAIAGVVFGALVWTISSAVSRVRRPS
jgi:hypothetical protein